MKKQKMNKRPITWLTILLVWLIPMQLGAQMVSGEKFVGNVLGTFIPENYSVYWNQVTPENVGKWKHNEGTRDIMNWELLDSYYNYAKSRGYAFKEHTFLWGAYHHVPGWIMDLSPAEQKEEVEEWIREYCGRYPDTDLIDVVNEPLHSPAPYRDALGGSGATGWDWIIWAFETTRKYTNAKLLVNDYGILNSDTGTPRYLEIVNLLKERGLIDGIGVQAHGYENADINMIRDNLDRFAETGLPVYVSEYEIDTTDDAFQLQRFQEQFPVLWEHPGLGGFTFWGYVQGHHWKPNAWLVSSGDIGASERPAITWLREYLTSTTPGPDPTETPDPTPDPTPTPVADGNIIIRARGTLGGENLELRVDDNVVASWTMSTDYQDYYANGTGAVELHFTNDDQLENGMDIQVDFIIYNGTTYQAEDQEINTAVYIDGACGGSNSEWLHCDGYIRFDTGGSVPDNLGDVNSDGAVDIVDALLAAQFYVGLNPSNFDQNNADTNCDGSIDIVDALLIAQYYVGLISSFC